MNQVKEYTIWHYTGSNFKIKYDGMSFRNVKRGNRIIKNRVVFFFEMVLERWNLLLVLRWYSYRWKRSFFSTMKAERLG